MALLSGCRAEEPSVGMTLVYECEGPKIVVHKFQPEGMRAGGPGVVGCGPRGGAEMAFMPGDGQGEMPRYVDVEWWVHPAQENKFKKRINLSSVIAPELIARVRANAQTTQLKLIMTFKGDQLEVKAEAYKWR
ncbi:hypothetical protein [Aquabacterium sp.]|uniref:hypothetical protein n=1 Tax=Aquabacterium sp. TaxID=1872578 RepID=UPI0024886A6D|nr:hypothetical protein [Aquabacterium sp.]MDI1260160.1 hypothetical protein [Aquabacterium sp.]